VGEEELKNEEQKKRRRFSQEQYDMLKRCSEKKDMTEWNEWRKKNLTVEVFLEGADLLGFYLSGIDLSDYGGIASKPNVCLKDASLSSAHLEGAKLHKAHMEGAVLNFSHLDRAFLLEVHLEGAHLRCAELTNANMCNAHLEGADLVDSELEGTKFDHAYLQKAKFQKAQVDGKTSFCYCEVDRETDFREVGLDSVHIDSATKQLLEYNVRRMNWEDWYLKQNRLLAWLVREFWQISDYGISTKQIVKTFFQWALIFAAVYLAWGLIDYHFVGLKDDPGIVNNLFVLEGGQEIVSPWLVPFRAFYFSIVTMTTLGFGDMYASAHSFLRGLFGHALLTLQVILGYMLLGALITRFAVLFTAGGPAGKFAKKETPTTHPSLKLRRASAGWGLNRKR